MKFIEIVPGDTVRVDDISRIKRNVDGFAIVIIGLDEIKTSFPYEAFINLLSIDTAEQGNGPDPTATALAY